MVNRIWQHHFGGGIVSSPDDFGAMGSPPTHPELLDYLAGYFMDHRWSVKQMHKLILLSNTYQQSSDNNARFAQVDPFNHLLWRQNIAGWSLSHCAIRSSPSAASSTRTFTGSPCRSRRPRAGTSAPPCCWSPAIGRSMSATPRAGRFTAMSIVPICRRSSTISILRTPTWKAGRRHQTTVPQQALFLMNSPLVVEQARTSWSVPR